MRFAHILKGSGLAGGWPRELLLTAIALTVGFVLMPVLIFFAGSATLGRYEGASVGRLFSSIYGGFRAGSPASWAAMKARASARGVPPTAGVGWSRCKSSSTPVGSVPFPFPFLADPTGQAYSGIPESGVSRPAQDGRFGT